MATLKCLVYVGDKALQPIFLSVISSKRYQLRVVEKSINRSRDLKFKACKAHGRDFTTIAKIPNLQDLCVEPLNLDGLYEMFFHYKSF